MEIQWIWLFVVIGTKQNKIHKPIFQINVGDIGSTKYPNGWSLFARIKEQCITKTKEILSNYVISSVHILTDVNMCIFIKMESYINKFVKEFNTFKETVSIMNKRWSSCVFNYYELKNNSPKYGLIINKIQKSQ